MAHISPELEQQFRTAPDRVVDLIVRTAGDASPHLAWLSAAGLSIRQQFRLSPGVAVSGAGRDALKLLSQSWVVTIELDAPVGMVDGGI